MTLMEILADDNFISVNRSVVKALGLECAVILGELCSEYTYWKNRGELKDGMFYCTVEKLKENTTLSKYQQLQAIEKLQKLGIVTVELHGVPATRYFKIDQTQLSNFLTSDSCQNSSCLKIGQLDVQKLDSSNTITSIQEINNTDTSVSVAKPSVIAEHSDKTKRKPLISSSVSESLSNTESVSNPVSNTSNKHIKNKTNNKNSGVVSPIKKKNLYEKCLDEIEAYTDDKELRELLKTYLPIRMARKDIVINLPTFRGMLKTLNRVADTREDKIKSIQQSIDRNYPTFYEPHKGYTRQKKDVFSEYGTVKSEKRADEVVVNVQF